MLTRRVRAGSWCALTERMPRVRIFTNIPASRSAPAPERPPPRPAFSLATHSFLPLVHFGVHAFPVLAELAPKTRHAALPPHAVPSKNSNAPPPPAAVGTATALDFAAARSSAARSVTPACPCPAASTANPPAAAPPIRSIASSAMARAEVAAASPSRRRRQPAPPRARPSRRTS